VYATRHREYSRVAVDRLDAQQGPLLADPGSRSVHAPSQTPKKRWNCLRVADNVQASDIIMKLSKKGTTPSQIGVLLRDLHGVGQVTTVTGTKILRILRKQGLAPEIPEDLYFLIKKAVSMRKHLDRFRKDRDTKFRLILVESRIHRLARYYKVCPALHCCPCSLCT
jgi:ribosomal protein S15P/S13E